MAAKIPCKALDGRSKSRKSGQSLVEFAIILPVFLAMFAYMIQVTVAINSGIVNSKYSQLRMMEILRNHADYPLLGSTSDLSRGGTQTGWQRFYIGVDRDQWFAAEERDDADRTPKPPLVDASLTRSANPTTDEEEETFPAQSRKKIRVRIKSFICLPPKFVPRQWLAGRTGSQSSPYLADAMGNETFLSGRFPYCRDTQ